MARGGAPAPFVPPQTGTLDQRVNLIAQALSRKADVTSEPVYSALLLLAPGGAAFRVSVDDAGALHTAVVDRT